MMSLGVSCMVCGAPMAQCKQSITEDLQQDCARAGTVLLGTGLRRLLTTLRNPTVGFNDTLHASAGLGCSGQLRCTMSHFNCNAYSYCHGLWQWTCRHAMLALLARLE